MKRLEFMMEHPEQNTEYCKPFTDAMGEYHVVYWEGDIVSMATPDAEYLDNEITPDALRTFAKEVNPYYDQYAFWSDTNIILDAMHETGCAHCPWRDRCEVMEDEI